MQQCKHAPNHSEPYRIGPPTTAGPVWTRTVRYQCANTVGSWDQTTRRKWVRKVGVDIVPSVRTSQVWLQPSWMDAQIHKLTELWGELGIWEQWKSIPLWYHSMLCIIFYLFSTVGRLRLVAEKTEISETLELMELEATFAAWIQSTTTSITPLHINCTFWGSGCYYLVAVFQCCRVVFRCRWVVYKQGFCFSSSQCSSVRFNL